MQDAERDRQPDPSTCPKGNPNGSAAMLVRDWQWPAEIVDPVMGRRKEGGQTINKVIDAPSADAEKFHNQTTHIWYSGGGLELLFDFKQEYDISTLHFWNYNAERFDVDNIDFTFFDSSSSQVGSLSIMPDLGSPGGIDAQGISLAAPLNVQFVNAFLTGSNGEVDFQNIGFTAEVSTPTQPSAVPLPAGGLLLLSGLGGVAALKSRKKRAA